MAYFKVVLQNEDKNLSAGLTQCFDCGAVMIVENSVMPYAMLTAREKTHTVLCARPLEADRRRARLKSIRDRHVDVTPDYFDLDALEKYISEAIEISGFDKAKVRVESYHATSVMLHPQDVWTKMAFHVVFYVTELQAWSPAPWRKRAVKMARERYMAGWVEGYASALKILFELRYKKEAEYINDRYVQPS